MSELCLYDVLEESNDSVLVDGVPDAERQGGGVQPPGEVRPRHRWVLTTVILCDVGVESKVCNVY